MRQGTFSGPRAISTVEEHPMRKLMFLLVIFGAALASLAATPTKANAWYRRWGVGYYGYPAYYYPGAYSYYYTPYYSGYYAPYRGYYYTPAYSSYYYTPAYGSYYYTPAYSSYYYTPYYSGYYSPSLYYWW